MFAFASAKIFLTEHKHLWQGKKYITSSQFHAQEQNDIKPPNQQPCTNTPEKSSPLQAIQVLKGYKTLLSMESII